ncbi:hypothetical protein Tco_0658115 [Tanacetum coccineum]
MTRLDHHDPNAQDMKPWRRYFFHKFTMSFCYGNDVTEMQSLGCDGEIDDMLRIRVREAESEEEVFTSVAWIRAFNINEPIYAELCHEFYSTYEFDEVCADDELQSKKIIKFRLGGRAHSLTLLEFARRLYDKVQKNDLWLLSMFDARHQNGVLTEDVVRSLSALIYCRDLDTITLRDLIDSDGKLIPEDPQPGVPRGAYNPPGYAQPQYDQYYQQYQPPPPQYQQQQDDDE